MKFQPLKTIFGLAILSLIATAQSSLAQQKTPQKTASSTAINFTNQKWSAVLAQAQKTNKYIFVDAYTSWCGPCKMLQTTTFIDKDAASYFNQNFINYSADMEKGEGVTLADKWQIEAYPTLMVFAPDGKMVARQMGYIDAKALIKMGQKALAKK